MPAFQSIRLPFVSRFLRRRKYAVLGQPQLVPLASPASDVEPQAPALADLPSRRSVSMRSKARHRVALPLTSSSKRRPSLGGAPSASMRSRKSDGSAAVPPAARAAVDKFLAGPEPESEEERNRRESISVLRKLSASGRVPGYVY